MRFYADQYQKYWSARNLACLQAPTGRGEQPAASVGLTPALPRRSRAGHGEGVAPHRPYAMAGGFGALVGDAALPSATRPTDVPRVDVGQVDVWQADVRDVRVDVAGHTWDVRRGTFGGAPPPIALADDGLRGGSPVAARDFCTARPCRPTSRSPMCPDHPAFAKIPKPSTRSRSTPGPMADSRSAGSLLSLGDPRRIAGSDTKERDRAAARRGQSEECPPAEGWVTRRASWSD